MGNPFPCSSGNSWRGVPVSMRARPVASLPHSRPLLHTTGTDSDPVITWALKRQLMSHVPTDNLTHQQ